MMALGVGEKLKDEGWERVYVVVVVVCRRAHYEVFVTCTRFPAVMVLSVTVLSSIGGPESMIYISKGVFIFGTMAIVFESHFDSICLGGQNGVKGAR